MDYQQRFIDILRSMVPANLSLAHEMSAVLGISIDSAYRRMRCETPITLEEVVKLCFHFNVPLEALNSGIPQVVTFHYNLMYTDEANLSAYLYELHKQITQISNVSHSVIHYAAEDIPVFYHFGFPELLRFKLFYWRKSILNHQSLLQTRFETFQVDEDLVTVCNEIHQAYQRTPSAEIWTEETIMSTIQQIKFYWNAGFFQNKASALELCDCLNRLLDDVKAQADVGMKRSAHSFNGVNYAMYQSDLMIGNNGVIVELQDHLAVFLGYLSFNFVRSENKVFAAQNKMWLDHLKAKSTLISGVSEKHRNQFFKSLVRHVDALRRFINADE
jgi:hypothetical protein